MDRLSHNYANDHRKNNSLRKRITYYLVLAFFIGIISAIYVYHPFSNLWHNTYEKLFGSVKDDASLQAKNHLPPVHFEFYTALSNAKVVEAETQVAISSHDELEESLSMAINHKGNNQ